MTALNPGAPPKPTPAAKVAKPLKARQHRIPDRVREAVFARDGWTCQWCLGAGGALDLHHKLRRSQGGRDTVANLVSTHRICHGYIHEHIAEAQERGFLLLPTYDHFAGPSVEFLTPSDHERKQRR